MKREELIADCQKKILEHQLNPMVPAKIQVWNDEKLPDNFPVTYEYLGHRLNQSTQNMQHVYLLDAREVLAHCESK